MVRAQTVLYDEYGRIRNDSQLTNILGLNGVFDRDYYYTQAQGSILEYYYTPLKFQNTQFGKIDTKAAGLSPNWWEKGRLANYTLTFNPVNYEQNMKIVVYVNQYVRIPQNWNKTCKGLVGVDKYNLTCEVDWYNYTITIVDAFVLRDVMPDTVSLVIENLTNPDYNVVTESFRVKTRTWDWYDIDYLDKGLELNFFCTFPCQTCNSTK